MAARRLLLVDGNSLANRAFYALPPLSTNEGVSTGAVFGFLTMLFRFLSEKKPAYIVVAFDHPSPTWRHRQFASYKATRKPAPPEFKAQIPLLKDVLDVLRLPRVEIPGYEADDIIGTLARKWEQRSIPVTILSGDRDCLQLVDENVQAILPVKGISQVKEYDPAKVLEDMGVLPVQVADFKALAGDASDNIPGVKGIGEKTAISLLRTYRSLDGLYEHLSEVKPMRVQHLLTEGRESAYVSRNLATIDTEVPLSESLDAVPWEGPDLEAAKALFARLQFHTLISRLDVFIDNAVETAETKAGGPSFESTKVLSTAEDLEKLAEEARASGQIAIYAGIQEITKDFLWPELIGVSTGRGPCLVALRGERAANQELLWKHFQPILVDPGVKKIGFDLKWIFTLCVKRGITLSGPFFDILVAAYLLDPTRTAYRMDDMASKYAGVEIPELPSTSGTKGLMSGSEALGQHLAAGANASFRIAQGCAKDLSDSGLTKLAEDVEFPLIQVLAAMEAAGIRVDLALGRLIRQGFEDALQRIEESIYDIAGEKFNLGSPKQLSDVLFGKLKLRPVKKTKTGYSTDAEVLETLSEEHELPAKILEYRQYAKLKSTYLDVLEDVVNPTTGRIHSTFHQTVTATGRLSSSEPNLQNIPVRGELGRSIRRIFIPDDGRLFLASDYSQIELRVMASMSGDPTMIEAFMKGEDIHRRTASEIFGVPLDEVDDSLRSKAKAVNFGIIYGISDYGLARNTGVSRKEAKDFIDMYFKRYPKIKEFMDASVEKARKDGFVTTILGRRRAIPDISSRIYAKRGFAERTAINTPIQGSAADIIKLAMVKIYRRLKDEGLKSRLILQVHDELIFEITPDEEAEMKDLVKQEMEGALNLAVPLKVDISVGKSWYDV